MARINLSSRYIIAALGVAGSIALYFAAPHEGTIYKAARCPAGIWTICRGHTQGVKEGDTATQEQCDFYYIVDVAAAREAYHRLVTFEHHPNVEASAIDFIFNAGEGNFASSSLRLKLNAGDRAGACAQYPRWKYMGKVNCEKNKKVCGGLITRRQQEKELCLSNEVFVCDPADGSCVRPGSL